MIESYALSLPVLSVVLALASLSFLLVLGHTKGKSNLLSIKFQGHEAYLSDYKKAADEMLKAISCAYVTLGLSFLAFFLS